MTGKYNIYKYEKGNIVKDIDIINSSNIFIFFIRSRLQKLLKLGINIFLKNRNQTYNGI